MSILDDLYALAGIIVLYYFLHRLYYKFSKVKPPQESSYKNWITKVQDNTTTAKKVDFTPISPSTKKENIAKATENNYALYAPHFSAQILEQNKLEVAVKETFKILEKQNNLTN